MSQQARAIETVDAGAVPSQWQEMLKSVRSGHVRIAIAENGATTAAIVSDSDLERLLRWEEEREELFEAIDRMRAKFADVPEKELKAEIRKGIAQVRAEMHHEREAKARG